MSADWKVDITTEGGITGRGLGAASASSDQMPAEGSLSRAVTAATPEKWQGSYRRAGNPHGYADQILYKLTLTRDGKSYSTSWYDDSHEALPRDLAALFEAAWSARATR